MYCPDALGKDLGEIPTEDKNMDTMVEAVREMCKQHGVKVAKTGTQREGKKDGRVTAYALRCVHGMPNRQKERQEVTTGAYVVEPTSRLPLHPPPLFPA